MDADYDLDGETLTRDEPLFSDRVYKMPLPRLLPSQQKVTELLGHLASFSELLVTVSGVDGSGKTTIAQALASQREEPDETIFLSADMMLGMPAILTAIAARWDLPQLPEDRIAAREFIRKAAHDLASQGNTLLVIIDQAEQLDSGTLNDIANFALQVPQMIAFCLFGNSGFADAIRENPANAPLHRVELEPLMVDEVAQLVQQVFSPGKALPLSQDEIDLIAEQSDGRPAAVLLAADGYFLSARSESAAPAEAAVKKGGRFPVTHILAIAGVAAALIMSFIYSGSDDESAEDLAVVTERISVDSLPLSSEAPAADPLASVPAGGADAGLSAFVEDTPVPEAPGVASATDYNYGGANVPAPEQAPAPVAAAPVAEPVPSVVAKPDVVKPTAPVAATKAPAATAKTTAEKTLMSAKAGFVVQLFGSYKAENAAAFRKQWQEKVSGNLYQYETVHSGRPWHVIVAGVFASRGEAQAAVNTLPAELRRQSPWIRDVKVVQEALR